MRRLEALTELFNRQIVEIECPGFEQVVLRGLKMVSFQSQENERIFYYVTPLNDKGRVHLKIVLSEVNQILLTDQGDVRNIGMRRRIVKEAKKRYLTAWLSNIPRTEKDWRIPETVEADLENLASAVEGLLREEERARILVRYIKWGANEELLEQFQKAQEAPLFPKKTLELLEFIDTLPAVTPETEPCHARFTLQQVAGKKGNTIDSVRHRFTPLEGQPFIEVVREGRGNQPTAYRYVKNKRGMKPATTREQNVTSDVTIEAPKQKSNRFESKDLVRYGERPKRYQFPR